jgi:hypothetical protein
MAEKNDPKKEEFKGKVVFNKGPRFYHLKAKETGEKDASGKPVMLARVLGPQSSIEVLDESEYNHLCGYKDVVDADKFVPHTGAHERITSLEKEKAELLARIAELEGDKKSEKKGK